MRIELSACALCLIASAPAFAGERDSVPLKATAHAIPVVDTPTLARKARPSSSGVARSTAFVLPARSAPIERRAAIPLLGGAGSGSGLDLGSERGPSGRPADNAEGASRAVREALNDYPKPRQPRTALSTALVLRIDGNNDSPSLSVGGGGVASVLWGMRPRP